MRRMLSYCAVGLLGMLCGLAMGARLGQKDHWGIINEYRRRMDDPQAFAPAGPSGLLVADDLPNIDPSLAALDAVGELNHLDLVFPNVPHRREVVAYWMQKCLEIHGVVEARGNPQYAEFKTSGVQPVHLRLWFTDEAEEGVKELIAGIESFAERGQGAPGQSPE